LRYGGGSGNINSCAFNNHFAFRQIGASNPPQRKAANRYSQPIKTATVHIVKYNEERRKYE